MVILTTSEAEEDILKSYDLHANCYITKPVDLDAVREPGPDHRRLLADDREAAAEAGGRMRKSPLLRLLLVEDNPGDARLLREMIGEEAPHDIVVAHVASMGEAERHLAGTPVDLVLLDLGLPDAVGLDAVRRAHAAAPRVPLVVLTGLDDDTLALSALKEGAEDYLVKGQIESRGLLRALRYAIERKILEESLFAEKERAQVSLKCIGDAVICTDIAGRITFLNVVAETTTGWSLREAIGRPRGEVLRVLDAMGIEISADSTPMAIDLEQTMNLPASWTLVRRDGLEIPIEGSAAPIHDRDGRAAGAVIVFRDVSAARAVAAQIAHSAEHDFLTGLPNRMLLNDRLGQAIALARAAQEEGRGALPRSRRLQAHQRLVGAYRRRQAAAVDCPASGGQRARLRTR